MMIEIGWTHLEPKELEDHQALRVEDLEVLKDQWLQVHKMLE